MPGSTRRLVKSRSNGRLRETVAAFIAAHAETILIAPSHSAGEDLVHATRGLAGVHRLTLIQIARDLAWPSMAELSLAPVTALGAEALAARAIYHARAAQELKYFEPVADLPGFARALSRTLSELRLAGIDCEALSQGGALAQSGEHRMDQGAGADLARLLARYQAELEDRSLADLARVLELASKAAESDRHRWLGLPLVLLDAPLESRAHREFFRSFAARAPFVLAAMGPDSDAADGSRCDSMAKALGITEKDSAAEDLDAKASLAAPMEHLRKYLFDENAPAPDTDDSCLEIFSAPGEGLEAVEIARRILRIAREGVPFDRMAILLRSPDRYQPLIEDALHRARIPAYFSKGSARPDPGGRAFLALLKCAAEKCSASLFSEYLSLGQVPAAHGSAAREGATREWIPAGDELLPGPDAAESPEAAPADTDEAQVVRAPAAWEKLLVDAAVIGEDGHGRWRRRLQGLEREFELRLTMLERDDQPARDAVARKLDQLRRLEEFALPLIAMLDALPRQAHWGEWISRLDELARAALRRPEPVLAMLAEFEPMGDVGPMMLEEVAEVLSDRLRFLRSEPPERRYGRVFVGSIDESRGREFGIVFLPGLAEGIFPQRAFEDPLLLDQSRRQIRELVSDESLLLRDDRVDQERARLKLAASAARDRLIASYPRMDVAEARPRVPSFYALELTRAAAGKLPELKGFERKAAEASPARLNWPAPAEAGDAIDDIEYDLVALRRALDNPAGSLGSARYLVETNDRLARSLRARYRRWDLPKWSEADGLITHSADTLAALAGHRLNARAWSPTSLQHFAACPYRFALHGIYGLRPREDASPIEQMDPLTRGGLFHAVQFALLNDLKGRAMLPVNAQSLVETLAIADVVLDETAAKYKEELAPAIPRVWETEIEDLRTDLRGWLQHVAANDSEWEPIHFEFAFGLARPASGHDPASSPGEAELAECGVRLRGSIDLVERNTATRVLRITDHKTGKSPASIPLYVGGGRFLQPLLYGLAAGQILDATVESGRLFYATQQGGYQHTLISINEKSRAFLTKLLSNIDGAIGAGFLPPHPQKDGCEYCDYRVVCGPYEELRTARHKDRRDDRLDPLIEIRAMA
jgi:ATP-dependent helicase/nuclease subunit B